MPAARASAARPARSCRSARPSITSVARAEPLEQLADPGSDGVREVVGRSCAYARQHSSRTSSARSSIRSAETPASSRIARAISAVGTPGRRDGRRALRGIDAVHLAQRSVQGVAVGVGGAERRACRRCRTAAARTPRGPISARTRCPARAAGERRDQPCRGVDVGERDQLDRRVHVAQRHRDQAGRHARAADVDRVGVGAGALPERLERERDPLALGGLVEQLEHAPGGASCRARSPVPSRACAW